MLSLSLSLSPSVDSFNIFLWKWRWKVHTCVYVYMRHTIWNAKSPKWIVCFGEFNAKRTIFQLKLKCDHIECKLLWKAFTLADAENATAREKEKLLLWNHTIQSESERKQMISFIIILHTILFISNDRFVNTSSKLSLGVFVSALAPNRIEYMKSIRSERRRKRNICTKRSDCNI